MLIFSVSWELKAAIVRQVFQVPLFFFCWIFNVSRRNVLRVLQSVIVPAAWNLLMFRSLCCTFRGDGLSGVPRVAYWKKENSQVNHSSSRKLRKMANFLLSFASHFSISVRPSSSYVSPHSRRKRKYVTLMDSNFDNAYPDFSLDAFPLGISAVSAVILSIIIHKDTCVCIFGNYCTKLWYAHASCSLTVGVSILSVSVRDGGIPTFGFKSPSCLSVLEDCDKVQQPQMLQAMLAVSMLCPWSLWHSKFRWSAFIRIILKWA